MCIVSNISTGYFEQTPFKPLRQWPDPVVVDFSELIKRLDAIDKKLGFKDCHDPEKEKFLKELADRVSAIEERLRKQHLGRLGGR